jgi:putative cardiolipin synthase
MADEYVMNAAGSNFVDMDVFVAGPTVLALSDAFDHYWNSEASYPVQSIVRAQRSRTELQRTFELAVAQAVPPEAVHVREDGRVLNHTDGSVQTLGPGLVSMLNLPFDLRQGRLPPLVWAHARVLYDPLVKTEGLNEREHTLRGTVTQGVLHWLATARSHIKMVSPYFLPSDAAVANLVRAKQAGVEVEVVTNSLASTDEPLVYGAYWPKVVELLHAGVTIRELSPSLSVRRGRVGIYGDRTGALHMKNAIVDHRTVFLGSMNLDPRSARLNTELGLLIDSPELARQLEGFTDLGSSYELRLNASGDSIEWVGDAGDGRIAVFDVPPETTAWQRLKLRLLSLFVPVDEL